MPAAQYRGSSDPHLLVVDDDERLRALLQRYLSSKGFRVSAAGGGIRRLKSGPAPSST